jgi:hypothetical protein
MGLWYLRKKTPRNGSSPLTEWVYVASLFMVAHSCIACNKAAIFTLSRVALMYPVCLCEDRDNLSRPSPILTALVEKNVSYEKFSRGLYLLL